MDTGKEMFKGSSLMINRRGCTPCRLPAVFKIRSKIRWACATRLSVVSSSVKLVRQYSTRSFGSGTNEACNEPLTSIGNIMTASNRDFRRGSHNNGNRAVNKRKCLKQ
jgi:hypothetical protein